MIKSNMGEVEISGTTTIILADFSTLTKGMVESLTKITEKTRQKKLWNDLTKEAL